MANKMLGTILVTTVMGKGLILLILEFSTDYIKIQQSKFQMELGNV